jgi:hypothetical protein
LPSRACVRPQPLTPAPLGDDPGQASVLAALAYFHDKAGWDPSGRYVTAFYQVGDSSGSYSSVFAVNVTTFCGHEVASASYGVGLINTTIQDTARIGAVVVAHFAVGWRVWGVYHGPVDDAPAS